MSISKGLPFAHVVVALAFIAYVHAGGGSSVGVDRNLPGRWCIASPLANDGRLQNDMNALCGRAVDCSSIRPGGACFNPNTVKDHASVVFNKFYKAHGSQSSACNFRGDAMLSLANPSSGSCIYP